MSAQKEEKRGKKRTLDELESKASEPPSPKRRKISPQNKQNIHNAHNHNGAISKIDDNDNDNDHEMNNNNDTITSSSNVDNINHNNNHNNNSSNNVTSTNNTNSTIMNATSPSNKPEKHEKILPNAIPSIKHKHKNHNIDINNDQVIELIDSDSPTTNTINNDELITINNETDIEMEDIDDNNNKNESKNDKEENDEEENGSSSPTQSLSQESNTNNNKKIRKISVSTEATIKRPNDENKYFKYLSIYTDERCLIHAVPDKEVSSEFNERPARLQALLDMIKEEKWNSQCRFIPKLDIIPRSEDIEGLHSSGYLADLKNSCSKIYEGNWNCATGSDTYVMRQTFDAALISAGLVIEATKHVYSHIPPLPYSTSLSQVSMDIDDKNKNNSNHNGNGVKVDNNNNNKDTRSKMDIDNDLNNKNIKIDADAHKKSNDKDIKNGTNDIKNGNDKSDKPNLDINKTVAIEEPFKKYAVVLNRPPGHHCDGEKYSGYCYINSTAVAIEKQLNQDTKVLVLDIDVHHGDGTQKLFYTEPTVLTVSFHQYDGHFFPSSGARTEYGPSRRHAAYGTNINVPLDKQASDFDVLYALRKMVWKIVEKFKPDIAFYAVGTDGVANDKANNATIFTPNLYGQIAYELQKYVDLIVVTTEGGYTTEFLASGMSCVLHGLTGQINTEHYPEEIREEDVLDNTIHTVAATTSDLRRVYNFEQDATEFNKIFNNPKIRTNSVDSSFELNNYIPNDDDSDIDYNEQAFLDLEDDEEFFAENGNKDKSKEDKKKKKKKDKKHKDDGDEKKKKKKKDKDKDGDKDKDKKKKKKKKKKDKEKLNKEAKEHPIDLTADDNDDDIDVIKSKKKKDKKSKKKKKRDKDKKRKKNKDKDKEKKNGSKSVSKSASKKPKSVKDNTSNTNDNNLGLPGNNSSKEVEVISLIEDSPINDTKNNNDNHNNTNASENGTKKKKKKKKKDKKDKSKSKRKRRSRSKIKPNHNHNKEVCNITDDNDDEVENNSDINNVNNSNNSNMTPLSSMFTLGNILQFGMNSHKNKDGDEQDNHIENGHKEKKNSTKTSDVIVIDSE